MKDKILSSIEAILFVAGDPVSVNKLAQSFDVNVEDMNKLLSVLKDKLDEQGGLTLVFLEDRVQLTIKPECADKVKTFLNFNINTKLSDAAYEVLAIIAYNQPVSRAFISEIRGVDSSGSLDSLIKKGLVEECGRLDLPGKPLIYRVTDNFLRCFSISSLKDLPKIPNDEEGEKENFNV
ncbi:MAG: SMC-Scp complex subunit ScpB [Clostridia bacterium]|nr:SMC-Scp complex subunit ScpB [Clostridia bacterium]